MNKLTNVILRSGIIPPESIREFQKWGMMVPDEIPAPPTTPEELITQIDQALQDEDLVVIRQTDLSAASLYLTSAKPAVLHLVNDVLGTQGDVVVHVARNEMKEYMLPWQSTSIEDLLINGKTYLVVDDKKVYFSSVRELFFGTTKAFLVCQVSREEPHDPEIVTATSPEGS